MRTHEDIVEGHEKRKREMKNGRARLHLPRERMMDRSLWRRRPLDGNTEKMFYGKRWKGKTGNGKASDEKREESSELCGNTFNFLSFSPQKAKRKLEDVSRTMKLRGGAKWRKSVGYAWSCPTWIEVA